MPPLILLPFGVFFVCCILQFWYLQKVRDSLIERHPDTFLSVEKSSIFPMQGLYKFARGGRYKDLNDAVLNRHVRNLNRLMIVAYTAWGCFALCLFIPSFSALSFSVPQLPLALGNGSYGNACCGLLTLKNGKMTMGAQEVSYVVESDKQGAYVLPTFYVGATPGGYVVRRDGQPLKLRLDNEAQPTTLELLDDTDGSIFLFHRLNGG